MAKPDRGPLPAPPHFTNQLAAGGSDMGAVGRKAVVISSTGFHSRRYIGQTGTAVMRMGASETVRWVLRFPSGLLCSEEGLYDECELRWT